jgi:hypothetical protein
MKEQWWREYHKPPPLLAHKFTFHCYWRSDGLLDVKPHGFLFTPILVVTPTIARGRRSGRLKV